MRTSPGLQRSPRRSVHRSARALALVTVVVLAALAGCSDDGDGDAADETSVPIETTSTTARPDWDPTDPPSTDEYVDGLVVGLTTGDRAGGDLVLLQEEATCLAPIWIDTMTTEALHRAQVFTDDLEDPGFNYTAMRLDQAQGEAMVAGFGTCGIDLEALVVDLVAPGVAEENRACAQEAFTPDLIERFLVAALVAAEPSVELTNQLQDISTLCGLER